MRRAAIIFTVVCILPTFGMTIESSILPTELLGGSQADVPTWIIGDWWEYEFGGSVDQMGMQMSAFGNIRFDVINILTIDVMGRLYHLYNLSVSGSFIGSGSGTIQGIDFTATITSATLSGYWWVERGDLAVLRDNESISASGDVTTILGTFPLTLDAEMTSDYDPAREDLDFPMEIGDQWALTTNMSTSGYVYYFVDIPIFPIEEYVPLDNVTNLSSVSYCNRTAQIDVPAGTFESFQATIGPTEERWFSEAVGFIVKWESHGGFGMFGDVWINLTTYGRKPPTLSVQEFLNPEEVNPGGIVTVYGTSNASQSSIVNVKIPATGDVWSTLTNATGGFLINISAPTIPDNTPTPVDFASHGVMVEIVDGSAMGYAVSTLTLILPDLFLKNVSFSPLPTDGNPTTISVEVHTSPHVGVASEILVSFEVDGIPTGNKAISSLGSDSFSVVSWIWTATAGIHNISIIVDPPDAIIERNETNNSLIYFLSVMGPDLAPADIRIEDGVSYFFPMGESFNYVSPVMNVAMGSSVNISTNVTNYGLRFDSTFNLTIAQTIGLGGPVIQPALLDEMVTPLDQGQSSGPFSSIWNVPLSPGMYFFNITVDTKDTVMEMSELNNTFILQFNVVQVFPDLYITQADLSLSGQPFYGNETTIHAMVHANENLSITSPFDVRFLSDGVIIGNDTIPSISAGGVAIADMRWMPNVGSHTIEVIVDPQDFVGESDESNNTAFMTVDVPSPDLYPQNISLVNGGSHFYSDPKLTNYASDIITTYIGSSVDISLEVINLGAPFFNTGFRVEFYETSGPGGPPSKPPFYDSGLLPSLAAGESSEQLSSSWVAPSPARSYFINLTVDMDDAVPELSETNNTFVVQIQVLEPEDVDYLPLITMSSHVKISLGKSVSITSRVKNTGSAPASANTTIAFYERNNPTFLLHSEIVPPLEGDELSTEMYGFIWSPSTAGTFVIVIEVDFNGDIPETNETNNRANIVIEVYEPPVTTLIIGSPKYGSSPIYVTSSSVFELVVVDKSGSGIKSVNYRIGSGLWYDYLETGKFTLTDEGLTTIEFYSEDNIGGKEVMRKASVYVDNTPPSTVLSHSGEEARPSTDFFLESSDEGSGVSTTWYRVDGGSWLQYFVPFSLQRGLHTIEFYSVDHLGNKESPASSSVYIGEQLGKQEKPANYKPLLSLGLAIALLIIGIFVWGKSAKEKTNERRFMDKIKTKHFWMSSALFAVIETIVGAASALTGNLAIPPLFGAGLIFDLVIFFVGLAFVIILKKKTEAISSD